MFVQLQFLLYLRRHFKSLLKSNKGQQYARRDRCIGARVFRESFI